MARTDSDELWQQIDWTQKIEGIALITGVSVSTAYARRAEFHKPRKTKTGPGRGFDSDIDWDNVDFDSTPNNAELARRLECSRELVRRRRKERHEKNESSSQTTAEELGG